MGVGRDAGERKMGPEEAADLKNRKYVKTNPEPHKGSLCEERKGRKPVLWETVQLVLFAHFEVAGRW